MHMPGLSTSPTGIGSSEGGEATSRPSAVRGLDPLLGRSTLAQGGQVEESVGTHVSKS